MLTSLRRTDATGRACSWWCEIRGVWVRAVVSTEDAVDSSVQWRRITLLQCHSASYAAATQIVSFSEDGRSRSRCRSGK